SLGPSRTSTFPRCPLSPPLALMYDTHAGITLANDVRLPALEPLISINAPIVTGDFVGATVVTHPDAAAAADVDNELFDDELLHAPNTNTPAVAQPTHTMRQRRE